MGHSVYRLQIIWLLVLILKLVEMAQVWLLIALFFVLQPATGLIYTSGNLFSSIGLYDKFGIYIQQNGNAYFPNQFDLDNKVSFFVDGIIHGVPSIFLFINKDKLFW